MTSSTLMQAILAMDSYNQGYNKGLDHGQTQIGLATISQDSFILNTDPNDSNRVDEANSFYAIAYNYNGETVISYRGTDQGSDIWTGWLAGAGIWTSPQVKLAADFYNALFSDTSAHGVTFTGHSLGGGLAGIMGSIYGREATAFDNMPFELSSENIYSHANLTDEEINSSFNSDALEDLRTYARNTFYNGGDPWEINRENVKSVAVEDEVLSYTRLLQNTPTEILDSHAGGSVAGLFGNLNEVQLHSQALLVNLQYAKDNSHTKWTSIAQPLWGAAFNVEIGEAVGFQGSGPTGHYDAASKMLTAIGYSAIDEDNLVFGSSGIRSLFNDADEVGELYGSATKSDYFEETITIPAATEEEDAKQVKGIEVLTHLLVQYSGVLAANKVEYAKANSEGIDVREGIIDKGGNNQTFAVDLSKVLWEEAIQKGAPTNTGQAISPLYKEQFIQAYFKNFDQGENFITEVLGGNTSWYNYFFPENTFDDQLLKQILQIGWSTEDTSVFDRFHVRAVQNADNIELSDRSYENEDLTGDKVHVDVYLGDNKYSDIEGSKGNDFIINGSATGVISASEGRDFISGGEGDDNADYSNLQVTRGIKFTLDKAKELGAVNAQDDVTFVQVDKNPLKAEERDLLHSIEVIEGSQYIDSLIIEELPDDLKLKFEGLGGKKNTDVTTFIDASALENGVEFITDKNGTGSLKDTGTGGEIEFVKLNAEFYNNQNAGAVIKLTDHDDVFEGTAGVVEIRGGDGNDHITVTNGTNVVYGGAGSDVLISKSVGNHFYGNKSDGDEDRFGVSNGTFLHDLGTEDRVWWGENLSITGGVQSWWMEKGWAAWQPTTAIFNAAPNVFLSSFGLLAPLSLLAGSINVVTSLMFQFYKTESGQLVIQTAMGRGGRAVIEDYELDLDTGRATGGVTVFKQLIVESGSLAALEQYVNLALKAGFGVGLDGQDPLILDLDGDGIELSSLSVSDTYFDLDGDGFAEHSAWTKGGDDGFLARDINDNGQIDDITELFGTAETPGLTALSALDSNQDGKISADDAEFDALRIWRDLDSDGQTDEGELFTLADLGISEISLNGEAPEDEELRGNTVREEAEFTRTDGTTGKIADVLLQTSEIDTIYLGDSTISTEAAALPELKGYGNLTSLRIAMTNDAALAAQVSTFANSSIDTSWDQVQIDTQSILFSWAGVDDITPVSLGSGELDTQKLAFLEVYSGAELVARDASGDPIVNNENELVNTWNEVLESSTLRLGAQGPWGSIFTEVVYDLNSNDFILADMQSLSDAYENALNSLSADPVQALDEWNDHWAPIFSSLTKTLHRSDQNIVRVDFDVQNLVRAVNASGTPLSLAQLAAGLGITGLQIADNSGSVFVRDTSQSGTQVYVSGAGNDHYTGGSGQDVFVFSSGFGSDMIVDNDVNLRGDRIRFTDINSDQVTMEVVGEDLIIRVIGTDDQIIVQGQYQAPSALEASQGLVGFGIEDIQFADGEIYEAGDIALAVGLGTDQDDVLDGTVREDIIEGLKGDDLLNGGDSGDIYFYTLGDGNDRIHDQRSELLLNGSDNLFLFGGITTDNISVTRDGVSDDITLSFSDGGSIVLVDQAKYSSLSYGGFDLDSRIEVLFFENGESWTWLDLQNEVLKQSFTAGDDQSYGFGTTDVFLSTEGNDYLSGFDGGDTYHFDLGSGQDTINDNSELIETIFSDIFSTDWHAEDKVVFGEGITREDVTFSRLGEAPDLFISIAGSDDTLTIVDHFKANKLDLFNILGIAWFDRIETFEFSDGTFVDWEEILNIVTKGDEGDNTLYGAYYADTLDGKAGDDYLSGGDDSDVYLFDRGYGADVIEEGQTNVLTASNDTIRFGAGIDVSDVIFSQNANGDDLVISFIDDAATLRIIDQFKAAYTGPFGKQWFDRVEVFEFEDPSQNLTAEDIAVMTLENSKTNGDDTIYGYDYEDILDGGFGNDFLAGGNENDTYVFGLGYGQDVFFDDLSNILSGDHDIVQFLPGINADDLVYSRNGDDLIVQISGTSDQFTIENQFNYGGIGAFYEIEEFHFGNGDIVTLQDMRNILLTSTTGDDHLIGYQTNDILDGGAGNDILEGGDGSDTYHFGVGYGNDIIKDKEWVITYSYYDTVIFGAGISASDLILTRSEEDVIVSINGYSDTLTLEKQLHRLNYYHIEEFQFEDGTVWNKQDILDNSGVLSGTDQGETLTGSIGHDTIFGHAGNDIINADNGNDRIVGGLGDDYLRGSYGADTYIYNLGDGDDIIYDFGNHYNIDTDYLILGEGLLASNAKLTILNSDTDDILLTFDGVDGSILFNEQLWKDGNGVEQIIFYDGTIWDHSYISNNAIHYLNGTSGDDNLRGIDENDVIFGGDGDDWLSGGKGNDSFDGGDGVDTVSFTYSDSDVDISLADEQAVWSSGTESIVNIENVNGSNGDNTITGDANDNKINGYEGDDILIGGAGNDWLIGDKGNDTISGGAGDDLISGGSGSDTLDGGDGVDTVTYDYSTGNFSIDLANNLAAGETVTNFENAIGSDGDNTITGTSGNNHLEGLGGDDTIFGGAGDDLISGGFGSDILDGGDGVDTVTYDYSSGNFSIDLVNNLAAGETVSNFENAIGSNGDNTISGTSGNNQLEGLDGDDMIFGGAGDDRLDGGLGNDTLDGQDGSDSYIWGIGDGNDLITDSVNNFGVDQLIFKDVLQEDIEFTQSASDSDDVIITHLSSGETITLDDQLYSNTAGIEEIIFSDGTVLNASISALNDLISA